MILALTLLLLLPVYTTGNDQGGINAGFEGNYFEVEGILNSSFSRSQDTPNTEGVTIVNGPSEPSTTRVERVPGCPAGLETGGCEGQIATMRLTCPDDFVVQNHTVITYDLASGEELSRRYMPGYCPQDPTENNTPVVTVSLEDFQRLPLKGSGITVHPDVEYYYVNLPVRFYSENTPQVLSTEILGTQVLVEATPSSYVWDYGNGESSGPLLPAARPRFSGRVEYTYKKSTYYDIGLTTSWTGRYSTDGGVTWQTIPGTATTTETFEQLPIAESIPLLVKPQVKTDQN